jgi:hypothetical protein
MLPSSKYGFPRTCVSNEASGSFTRLRFVECSLKPWACTMMDGASGGLGVDEAPVLIDVPSFQDPIPIKVTSFSCSHSSPHAPSNPDSCSPATLSTHRPTTPSWSYVWASGVLIYDC